MAVRVSRGRRRKLVISKGIHPEYRRVLETYNHGIDIEEVYLDIREVYVQSIRKGESTKTVLEKSIKQHAHIFAWQPKSVF